VRLLLWHAGGGHSPVYPYFYMVYSTARDLSTLVMLNYINDFYDTRAAKRIIPLMLSAGVAGSAIAGFSNPLLGLTIGVGNVPLAWIACLLVSLTLIRVIHARFPLAATGTPGRTVQPAGRTGASAGGSLRARLGYMRGSPLLRWLAVATFAMVVLMRLLNVESSRVFVQAFSSRPQALFEFYGLFGGVISVLGFVLQSLVVGRLVTAFGVGGIYLLFPSIALGAAGLLGALPTFGAAVGGRLTYTVLKQSFRNPLDALIFNSVPARVKNGAKALVNGVVVPLGVLFAGVFLLLVQPLHGAAAIVGAASIVVAAAYLCASLKVRGAYAGALAALVADGSVAACLEHADLSDFERPNPALKPVLERHLASERNESMVAFLAELLLDLWGHEALPAVLELLQTRGPSIRAAVLELLSRDGSWPAAVRDACLAGLRDEEPGVRSAAAVAAARMPGLERDPARVCALRAVLQEPSTDEARAAALTALVRLPDARTWPDVQAVLDGWLAPDAAERVRILALDVLAGSSDPRLAPALAAAAVAPSAELRRHAAVTAGALEDGDVLNHGLLELISRLAHDEDASVRLAAVPVLQRIGAAAIEPLRTLLGDPDVEVRRAACRAFPRGQVARLVPLLEGENRVLRESAAYVLARVRGRRMRPQLHSAVQLQVEQAQRRASLAVALASLDSPAAVALRAALAERADESCAQALWLLDADSDERALRGIADALRSEDQSTRANALEALEAATSPALARLLGPLLSDKRPTEVQIAAGAALGALLPALPRSEPQRRPVDLVEPLDGDGWLAALAIETALAAADELGGRVVLRRILQEC
ncbi:MAG TPA: HEAT repeat domain-containing protein, partial [Dehalococcoidia bacterium]|nr:HEAT repeat domain-containing protein [Dehalococcoidia bacterium]